MALEGGSGLSDVALGQHRTQWMTLRLELVLREERRYDGAAHVLDVLLAVGVHFAIRAIRVRSSAPGAAVGRNVVRSVAVNDLRATLQVTAARVRPSSPRTRR